MRVVSFNNVHEKRLMKRFPVDLLLQNDVFQKKNPTDKSHEHKQKVSMLQFLDCSGCCTVTTATLYYSDRRGKEAGRTDCAP